MKSFKQFTEAKKKEIVFTFGRFNPPTVGHEKLIKAVIKIASGRDYKIFASQSNKPDTDPLKYKEKVSIMRKMFPKYARNIILDEKIKTVFNIAVKLYDQGYTDVTMIVGSDRIKEFKTLLNKFNGVKSRHGFYEFDTITLQSAGERDPDADGVSGMSASKMRAAATDGDFKAFSSGIPRDYGDDMGLFNLLRKRMGLKEMTNFRKHIQLPTVSEKRERYISGAIFNEGDTVYANGNVEITIQERKSNYVVCSKGNKYFIQSLEEALEDGTDKAAETYKKGTPGQLSEKQIKGLEKKSEESGIAYSVLKSVFDRGMGAYKTSHRPGTTPQQWAFARVNSFISKSKGTWGGADKDLAAKVKKESVNEGEGKSETWEDGFKRRVVKVTKPEHLESGYKWRIKGKERDNISIKLYKEKPNFEEYKKQMKRVAGHEFGG